MIEWTWRRTSAIASGWNFFVLYLFAFLFSFALFHPRVATYPEGGSFDGRWRGFRPSEATGILAAFDGKGVLETYRQQESTIDLVFPLIYSLLLAVGIAAAGRSLPVPHWLVALPYAAALADYCENFSVLGMIAGYRQTKSAPYALAVVASVASRLKWGFAALSLVALVVVVVWRLAARVRSVRAGS